MSLYDDYLKDSGKKSGTLSEQYTAETGAKPKEQLSFYDQYQAAMSDKPAPAPVETPSFLSRVKGVAETAYGDFKNGLSKIYDAIPNASDIKTAPATPSRPYVSVLHPEQNATSTIPSPYVPNSIDYFSDILNKVKKQVIPENMVEPGSQLEKVTKSAVLAKEQFDSVSKSYTKPVTDWMTAQAKGIEQSISPVTGNRDRNLLDIFNIIPALTKQVAEPVFDLIEPITGKKLDVKLPAFNNEEIMVRGIQSYYDEQVKNGVSPDDAYANAVLKTVGDMAVIVPMFRAFGKIGLVKVSPETLLKQTVFETAKVKEYLQTGEPLPKPLMDAFKALPNEEKAKVARGLVTQITEPKPSLIGKIFGISDSEAAKLYADINKLPPVAAPKLIENGTVADLSKQKEKLVVEKAKVEEKLAPEKPVVQDATDKLDPSEVDRKTGVAFDPKDLPDDLKPYSNKVVTNTAGNDAVIAMVPLENFGTPEFTTLNQDKYVPGQYKINSPIEATYDIETKQFTITDGANRFAQAMANADHEIPAVVEFVRDSKPVSADPVIKKTSADVQKLAQKMGEIESAIAEVDHKISLQNTEQSIQKESAFNQHVNLANDIVAKAPETARPEVTRTLFSSPEITKAAADLASPVPIRGEGGKFQGSISDKNTVKMSVEKLSSMTENSLAQSSVGMREKSMQYFRDNPQEITAKPIRIREVDGKTVIEDGRHRLQVAQELGIDNIAVEDVTPQYTGKKSTILKTATKKPAGTLASSKGEKKTITKILERMSEEKPNAPQEVPKDFKVSARAKQILEEFGIPSGEKSISKKFLGLYKFATKKVRVQSLYDITTVTHEAIHAIDDQIGFTKKLIEDTKRGAPVRKELTDIYEKLYPTGSRAHPLNVRMMEGLAVFFENYFYNPSEIESMYPNLVEQFIKPEGEFYNPLFTKLVDRMNELVDDYAQLSPEQRIASRIRTGKEIVKEDTGFTKKQRAVFELFNRFEPLKRYAKIAGVSETWDDPVIQAFNIMNKNSIAAQWVKGDSTPILLKDGNFRNEKGSVETYIKMIKGDEKAFYSYLVARRVHEGFNNLKALQNEYEALGGDMAYMKASPEDPIVEMYQKMSKIKSVLENDDFPAQDAAAVVSKYAGKFAEAEKVFDDVNRRLIDLLEENGLLDADTAKEYRAEKGYASFKRFIDDDLTSVGTKKGGSSSKVSSLKERKGSQLDLQSPVQSQILAINEAIGKSMENTLWLKVADLAAKNPEIARRFEKVEAAPAVDANGKISYPQERDPNIIRVFRNGKREFYKVAPELIAVSKTLAPKEYDTFSRLLRIPASLFTRLTTSANPLFALGNVSVDQFSATMQSKTGYKPILDPVKSFIDLVKSDEGVAMYKALGGKRQTLASFFDLSADEVAHKLAGGETKTEKAISILDASLGALELPSNTSELITRFAEFKRSIEAGEPASVAMYRASEVTTAFQLQGNFGGQFGREAVKSIPYLNAQIQVLYKFGRTFKSNPGRVAVMAASLFAAALTTAIGTMSSASDEQKRLLSEQPVINFGKYIYIPNPDGKTFTRLKIPQEIGAFTGMAYLYVVGHYNGNEAAFKDYLDLGMSALPQQVQFQNPRGAVLSMLPEGLGPSVLAAANTKTFPDVGPIVPQYVAEKAPKEQYNAYTSEVAKTIGGLLGASPMIVDYWIKAQFGSVGSMLTGNKPSVPIYIAEGEYALSGRAYNTFYDNRTLTNQQFDEIRKNNPDNYTDSEKENIKIEKGTYDKMADALADLRKIGQKDQTLPEEVKQQAYQILLKINGGGDQEEIRSDIGSLKEKIGELKD